ncbi:MAG: hypothetical protein ACLPKT_26030, partial [Methylocella sp.]
ALRTVRVNALEACHIGREGKLAKFLGFVNDDLVDSQRAWDLFVKSRYTAEKNPGRALILASGTPITNYL